MVVETWQTPHFNQKDHVLLMFHIFHTSQITGSAQNALIGIAEILSKKDLSRWMVFTSPSEISHKIAIWAFLSTSGYMRGMEYMKE